MALIRIRTLITKSVEIQKYLMYRFIRIWFIGNIYDLEEIEYPLFIRKNMMFLV